MVSHYKNNFILSAECSTFASIKITAFVYTYWAARKSVDIRSNILGVIDLSATLYIRLVIPSR